MRDTVRKFVEKEVKPFVTELDEKEEYPHDIRVVILILPILAIENCLCQCKLNCRF